MQPTDSLWLVSTNTDLTEGRGYEKPIALCRMKETALRLGRKRYVQGSDCPVQEVKLLHHDGRWYVPYPVTNITEPSAEDIAEHNKRMAYEAAAEKAKAAGLSDEDIKNLRGG